MGGALVDVDHAGVALGAVADDAAAVLVRRTRRGRPRRRRRRRCPGRASRPGATRRCRSRSSRSGIRASPRAEADLRQARAGAHQHREGARADLGIERPVIARLDWSNARRWSVITRVKTSSRPVELLGLVAAAMLVRQRQAFHQRRDVDAAGLEHGAGGQVDLVQGEVGDALLDPGLRAGQEAGAHPPGTRRAAGRGSRAGSGRCRAAAPTAIAPLSTSSCDGLRGQDARATWNLDFKAVGPAALRAWRIDGS